MQNQGKSTLLNKQGKMVASGFGKHPIRAGWFINIVIYLTDVEYVMCVSEVAGNGDPESQRACLGQMVPGADFALFAARGIGRQMPYADRQERGREDDVARRVAGALTRMCDGLKWT